MTYDSETTKTTVVEGPDGRRWIRPDNGCYPCDVNGPNCPWHRKQWVLEDDSPEQ